MDNVVFDAARVLVAGDTHGDVEWIAQLCASAGNHGCGALVVLGDFGLWPDADTGRLNVRFLSDVSALAVSAGVEIVAIDGNHDFHPAARALFPADSSRMRALAPRLRWADRGARFSVRSCRFGALGGAVSTDRASGSFWWPTERVSEEDVEALGSGELDVLLCHDAPAGVHRGRPMPDVVAAVANDELRALLRRAVDACRPQLVFHGHHHTRVSDGIWTPFGGVQVEGLASNIERDGRAWGVLSVDDLSFDDGTALTGA